MPSTPNGDPIPVVEMGENRQTVVSLLPILSKNQTKESWHEFLLWPPDVFALCCRVLKYTGMYQEVLRQWPSARSREKTKNRQVRGSVVEPIDAWRQEAREIGRSWALYSFLNPSGRPELVKTFKVKPLSGALGFTHPLPQVVLELWTLLFEHLDDPLLNFVPKEPSETGDFESNPSAPPEAVRPLVLALLELVAFADEASVWLAAGPIDPDLDDDFRELAEQLKYFGGLLVGDAERGSLAWKIPTSWATILPKHHTPKSGLSINSLSHYLAFHQCMEIQPTWNAWSGMGAYLTKDHGVLNLLLVPSPFSISPTAFKKVKDSEAEYQMPGKFGLFEFDPYDNDLAKFPGWEFLDHLILESRKHCDNIHGIIFPEASMTQAHFDEVFPLLQKHLTGGHGGGKDGGSLADGALLIAGLGYKKEANDTYCVNQVIFRQIRKRRLQVDKWQDKHHRWRLDSSQIRTYGLASFLDVDREWWENARTVPRRLNFFQLRDNFSLCCLICEDLARQEPVSGLIRAVGPTLVIALLMDSAQINSRWPGRYATVLADDPGSAVLTLTSVGMVDLASPPPNTPRSRSVGLWKDPFSSATELVLEPNHHGILLTLSNRCTEEYSADGRSDFGSTSTLQLLHWRSLPGVGR